MSPEQAYQLLGVRESANFEQIMTAKKNLVNKAVNDKERITQVLQCMLRLPAWLDQMIAPAPYGNL